LAEFLFLCSNATGDTVQWDYQQKSRMPEAWNGLSIAVNPQIKTPDGEAALEVTPKYDRDDLLWSSYLTFMAPSEVFKNVKAIEISLWARGEKGTKIDMRITSDRKVQYSPTRSFPLSGEWQRIQYLENLQNLCGMTGEKWICAPRLLLGKYKAGQQFYLGPVCLKPVMEATPGSEAPASVMNTQTTCQLSEQTGEWRSLDTGKLYIQAGSALDFSPFADLVPAGTYGRVIANKQGELAFSSKPETAVRFLTEQLMPPSGFERWSDEEIASFAAAAARQGYNLARLHFFDYFISGAAHGVALRVGRYKLPEKPEDITFNQKALDRFYFLLAELKKHGVYWNLDFMSSFSGYTSGRMIETEMKGSYNTKVQLFVNPNFRANWKAAVTRLLNDVNPYTKLPIRDDPALAMASCLNEQEILFPYRDYGREFDPVWHLYLAKKYGDYSKIYVAWSGMCGEVKLPEEGTIDQVPSINPVALTDTPAGRDMAHCCGEMEYEMSSYYLTTLQELGFTGLVSNWNMRTRLGTVPARSLFPVITMNSYHAHPIYGTQTRVNQESALKSGGDSFKNQTMARFLDRPFVNTEFGLVFWNPYRHEQGLLFGAGAAFQNWSALTCHANQVIEEGSALSWFETGCDPVIRASELVEAFAFRRGDVAASPHTIEVPLSDEFIYDGRAMGAIDDELSRLWMLCRVGISYGKKQVDFPSVLVVSPDKTSTIGGGLMFSAVENSQSHTRLSTIVDKLRALKVLASENTSNPEAGILESDTRQITLDTNSGGELQVRTPRLEGIVLKHDKLVKLDAMTIEKCSIPASVTLISLESKNSLRDAGHLLLVFSSDARNSQMTFANQNQDTLSGLGTLPVVVRTGQLKIVLARHKTSEKVKAYALKLNGERAEEVPVEVDGSNWIIVIDTARLTQAGPTPFFELMINN